MRSFETAIVVAALLGVTAVVTSKLSSRLGVPAVLLFLGLGMLAGTDGPGGIEFDDIELTQAVGVVALAYILFSGGLDTRWTSVRPTLAAGASLATIGVLVTAVITGLTAAAVFPDISVRQGLLLGAIVSSTDAAAVFSVLRSRALRLRGRVQPLLELESGSNDPMAVFLTLGMLEIVTEDADRVVDLVLLFVQQMAVGGVLGVAGGVTAVFVVNRLRLEYDGLYPVLTVAFVALLYGVTALLGGSGFLAVYLAGITMGNGSFLHRASVLRFHDAVAWLMQVVMFLFLGLLVNPAELGSIAGRALAVAAALVFVARPVAVLVALGRARWALREKLFISWVGLRGAVPIVLATYPLRENAAGAGLIFDVVFFVVLVSVLVQGTTIGPVARLLGVAEHDSPRAVPVLLDAHLSGGRTLQEVNVEPGSFAQRRAVVDLRLPQGVLLVLVSRGELQIVPQGATLLDAGDRLLVLVDDAGLAALRTIVETSADS